MAIMEKQEKWQKKDTSKSEDSKLDDALEDSFPASDPPAQTDPLNIGRKRKTQQQGRDRK
jgi:hypothetical protein